MANPVAIQEMAKQIVNEAIADGAVEMNEKELRVAIHNAVLQAVIGTLDLVREDVKDVRRTVVG